MLSPIYPYSLEKGRFRINTAGKNRDESLNNPIKDRRKVWVFPT